MLIKVKCCKCNELLCVYSYEENRREATNAKKNAIGKMCCGTIGFRCKN